MKAGRPQRPRSQLPRPCSLRTSGARLDSSGSTARRAGTQPPPAPPVAGQTAPTRACVRACVHDTNTHSTEPPTPASDESWLVCVGWAGGAAARRRRRLGGRACAGPPRALCDRLPAGHLRRQRVRAVRRDRLYALLEQRRALAHGAASEPLLAARGEGGLCRVLRADGVFVEVPAPRGVPRRGAVSARARAPRAHALAARRCAPPTCEARPTCRTSSRRCTRCTRCPRRRAVASSPTCRRRSPRAHPPPAAPARPCAPSPSCPARG